MVDFFITKQTSLHPFDFIRNLFHLLVNNSSFNKPEDACFKIRFKFSHNTFCETTDNQVDNTYLWFIVPQLLKGFSSLLVSMTVFEFICAQAPRTTKGLLIGLWHATFSIRYLLVGLVDEFLIEKTSWLISEGVNAFLILVSLVLFSCVSTPEVTATDSEMR